MKNQDRLSWQPTERSESLHASFQITHWKHSFITTYRHTKLLFRLFNTLGEKKIKLPLQEPTTFCERCLKSKRNRKISPVSVKSTEIQFRNQNIIIESLLPVLIFQWLFFVLLQSKKKQLLFLHRYTACVVRPCRNYWRMKVAMNIGFSSDRARTSEVNLSTAPPYCLHLPEQVWHELDSFGMKLRQNIHCRRVPKLLQLVLGIQNTGRS